MRCTNLVAPIILKPIFPVQNVNDQPLEKKTSSNLYKMPLKVNEMPPEKVSLGNSFGTTNFKGDLF